MARHRTTLSSLQRHECARACPLRVGRSTWVPAWTVTVHLCNVAEGHVSYNVKPVDCSLRLGDCGSHAVGKCACVNWCPPLSCVRLVRARTTLFSSKKRIGANLHHLRFKRPPPSSMPRQRLHPPQRERVAVITQFLMIVVHAQTELDQSCKCALQTALPHQS